MYINRWKKGVLYQSCQILRRTDYLTFSDLFTFFSLGRIFLYVRIFDATSTNYASCIKRLPNHILKSLHTQCHKFGIHALQPMNSKHDVMTTTTMSIITHQWCFPSVDNEAASHVKHHRCIYPR